MSDSPYTSDLSLQLTLKSDFPDSCDLGDIISIRDRKRFIEKMIKYTYPMSSSLRDNFIKAISNISPHFISNESDRYVTAPITTDDHTNLYRCISFIIFSTEKFWVYVRDALINHLYIHSDLFNPLCKKFGEKSVDRYKKRCQEGYYSPEIDIRAISHFFDIPIYVFTSKHLKKGKRPIKILPCDTEVKRKKTPPEHSLDIHALFLHKNENPVFFQPVISFNQHYKFSNISEENISEYADPLKLIIPKKKYLPLSERPISKQNNALKENTSMNIKPDSMKINRSPLLKSQGIQSIPGFINEDERQTLVNIIWRGAEYFGDLQDKLPIVESDSAVFEIKQLPSDGNDFYKCLSYLITSRDDFHAEIRIALSKFMSDDMNAYLLNRVCLKIGDQDIYSYLSKQNVQKLGVAAGTVELHAAALMLEIPICVVKGKLAKQLEIYHPEDIKENQRGLILYYGCNHYSPVVRYNKCLKHEALNIRTKAQSSQNVHSRKVINDENANPALGKQINRKRKIADKPEMSNNMCDKKEKTILTNNDSIPKENDVSAKPLQETFSFGKVNSKETTENQNFMHSIGQSNFPCDEINSFDVNIDGKNSFEEPNLMDIDSNILNNLADENVSSALDDLLKEIQTSSDIACTTFHMI